MDESGRIIEMLREGYGLEAESVELTRDSGSAAYTVLAGGERYFLRQLKQAFFDTSRIAVDIQVYLQNKSFPVPGVIFTKSGRQYYADREENYVLYEYIDGGESEPEVDAERIGELTARLHVLMRSYPGELVKRDRFFYIGRYIDQLRKKKYPRVAEFEDLSEEIWQKIKALPRGYAHGDLYCGNIQKTPEGKLYFLDFDTSCEGFPMYDAALICNMTEYFRYDERNLARSDAVFGRYAGEYTKYAPLTDAERDAYHALIALQHFSTQATIIELYGLDCISEQDLDGQLDWLYRWKKQCGGFGVARG